MDSAKLKICIFPSIDDNFNFINTNIGQNARLVKNKYDVFNNTINIGIIYINGISDNKYISSMVIKPLLDEKETPSVESSDILNHIQTRFIYAANTTQTDQMEQIIEALLNGDAILFVNNSKNALVIGSRNIEKRSIEKPENEVAVFGSLDSFTEDLDINCSLIIKRLPNPSLQIENLYVGTLSHTQVRLIWIKDIANEKIISDVRQRINKISIDNLNSLGELGELIEEKPLSVFPKYKQSQRPDMASKYLCDGHFVLLCDSSPFAFIAPSTLWDFFKTMDDYAERPFVASFLRLVRYLSFIIATTASAFYLSFVTFNHSIVPPALAINIASGRSGVPFPSVVELIVMTLSISIIREASLRIPGSVGYFVGTLAAIIIGQAAVTAGYISASLIIIIAITAISAFAISSTSLVYPARLINYFLILISSLFGMFGMLNGIVLIVLHLVSLKSFGVPYLYPVVPFDLEGIKDTFTRAPFGNLKKRLRIIAPFNRNKMDN